MKLEITDLQRVNLQPGDHLVVRVRGRATTQLAAFARAIVRDWADETSRFSSWMTAPPSTVIATEALQEIAR